jgi:glycosyltransferase involved in cell wall biosynthesis
VARDRQPGASGITLTTPYAEGAILAIARSACARQQLDGFLTTLYWGDDFKSWLFARSLARRRLMGVPNRLVWQGARSTELAHVISKRIGPRRKTADLMYRTKERFDHAASREVGRNGTGVIVATYAAALETFEVARDLGIHTVLHFVNSHPHAHNALLKMAGAPPDSIEYIPTPIAERVGAELGLADLVLVPSSFVARQLLDEGISSERLAIVRYGVDPVLFAPVPRRVVKRRTLNCLYVGQISWRKGIRVLVDAARMLDGFATFNLVGPLVSPEVLRGLPPNVVVRKTVSHAQLRDEYTRADVFVLPSIEDAFPLVTLEALASGLPVVVSDGAGTTELITHGHHGFIVPSGSSASLADALRELGDPHLRAQMGDAGRALIAQAYSWNDYGSRVLATLDRLRLAA